MNDNGCEDSGFLEYGVLLLGERVLVELKDESNLTLKLKGLCVFRAF